MRKRKGEIYSSKLNNTIIHHHFGEYMLTITVTVTVTVIVTVTQIIIVWFGAIPFSPLDMAQKSKLHYLICSGLRCMYPTREGGLYTIFQVWKGHEWMNENFINVSM